MTPAGEVQVGSTYMQWNPAQWCPLPGKPDAVGLPKFLPGCLDHQLGEVIPLRHPCGAPLGQARIEGYLCADDGSGVWMKFRIVSLDGTPHEHS